MKRLWLILAVLAACSPKSKDESVKPKPQEMKPEFTDEYFRKKLTPEQYRVCREDGTESPGSGKYLEHWEEGAYNCVACGHSLFASKTKYKSCDWPSFYDQIGDHVTFNQKTLEATCSRCGSHLGHVFNDGPPPTGKRY